MYASNSVFPVVLSMKFLWKHFFTLTNRKSWIISLDVDVYLKFNNTCTCVIFIRICHHFLNLILENFSLKHFHTHKLTTAHGITNHSRARRLCSNWGPCIVIICRTLILLCRRVLLIHFLHLPRKLKPKCPLVYGVN